MRIRKTKGIKNENEADIFLYTPLQNVSHHAGGGIGIDLWLTLECTDLPENGFLLHAQSHFLVLFAIVLAIIIIKKPKQD